MVNSDGHQIQQMKTRPIIRATLPQKRSTDSDDQSGMKSNRTEIIRKRVAGLPYSPAPVRDQAPVHLDIGKY